MTVPGTARRVWAIVPAAGTGQRFAADTGAQAPKQYAKFLGKTVLEWTLRALKSACMPS